MEVWKANKDVMEQVGTIVREWHPDLLPLIDEIAVIFREKGAKTGGVSAYGKAKKTPQILNVLGEKEYKFVLDLAADVWETELDSRQRVALLDHLLCSCRCDFDDKTGEYKCFITPPDVVAFKEEIERHGLWHPHLQSDASAPVMFLEQKVKETLEGS